MVKKKLLIIGGSSGIGKYLTKNMGRGEGTSRELPDGWIDFDPNSVTYNLGKHICNLSK